MSRISLVMATLGRVREIEDFVQSLTSQTYKDYELIIVDQNPDDRLIPVINLTRDLGIPLDICGKRSPTCVWRETPDWHKHKAALLLSLMMTVGMKPMY